IAGIDYQTNPSAPSKPASLHVKNVVARAPYARVIIESDRSVNVARVLSGHGGSSAQAATASAANSGKPPASNASGKANGAAAPARHGNPKRHRGKPTPAPEPSNDGSMAIAIDAIDLQDGSANYADLWIQPHFAVGIQTLNGSILGLSSSPSSRAKVELKGKVDRYAPVHIWGETNPLAATTYSDIKMNFKGVELTSVTPYSGRFAGY